MKVVQNATGQHEIQNDAGVTIAGPFATNAEAWRAADRLEGDPISPAEKRTDYIVQKMVSSGPAPSVPSRVERKRHRKMAKAAAKAPKWLRDGAAAHFDPTGRRQHRDAQLGTFGPASEVRRIDPAEYARMKSGA